MRWDFQRILGLDLNDWLRGERDWSDFWDLKEQLPTFSKYRVAQLNDPDLIEYLAQQPDPKGSKPSIEEWDSLREMLSNTNDLLLKILYATAHDDPSNAPRVPRPEYPHQARRREIKREKRLALARRIVPHEFQGGEG